MTRVVPRPPGPTDAGTRLAIRAQVKADAVAFNRSRPGETIFAGMKVLVVDDDSRNAYAMTVLLERGDAVVITANSGLLALVMLERNPDVDVILMDIMMTGMDGYATMRAIRSIDRFKSIMIIAVTAKVVTGDRERCIDAGANDYVPKPVDVGPFLAMLTRWARPDSSDSTVVPAGPIPDMNASSPAEPPARKGVFAGVKVLVVDNDLSTIFAMAALLEGDGAVVVRATSGLDALTALQRHPDIDLVLMDIMMTGMDGYATMRAIRGVDRLQSLPIIAVTAKVLPGERQRCIDAGADDYVTKPLDVMSFVQTLERWSGIKR